LKENGPDPLLDKDIFTEKWLIEKLRNKRVPIKALLLDQANISGIGNWMGDEILYNAKIHPEQYSNTLSDAQIKQLHTSTNYVCSTSVELLADSDKFPKDWLFKHRWAKVKKNQAVTLPNGNKIVFLTVGGRTSAVVPAVQKKAGSVAKELGEADDVDEKETKVSPTVNGKRKRGDATKEAKSTGDHDTQTSKSARKKTTSIEGKPALKEERPTGRRSSKRNAR